MQHDPISAILQSLHRCGGWADGGRVRAVGTRGIEVAGLGQAAALGDRAEVSLRCGQRLAGEVVGLGDARILLMPDGPSEAVSLGDRVMLRPAPMLFPCDAWLGRVVDPDGQPLDGRPVAVGSRSRPLVALPPEPAQRRPLGARLDTGLCLFDSILPVARGQRLGIFAGPGVGKSSLLGAFARGIAADVVVIGLVGERGRDLGLFLRDVLGPAGMARTVVVAATSDRPPLTRRRAAPAAMAVAEHFRDAGRHVLLLLDSVTRLAEAHREVAVACGEPAGLRGWPASMVPLLAGLAERAGPGVGEQGDITALFTVLVAGSDIDEPVADTLRGLLDGHILLDRTIAERGRFPAVDVLRSVSRALPGVATAHENGLFARARRLLSRYEEAEMMLRTGLYTPGADPELDEAVRAWPALDAFFAASEPQGVAASLARLAACLDQPDATAATDAREQG